MNKKLSYQSNWNLSLLQYNEKTWDILRKEIEDFCNTFVAKWKNRKDWLSEPTVLRQALDEYIVWESKYSCGGDEAFYLHLKQSLDQNDPQVKAAENLLQNRMNPINQKLQFFFHKLSKVSKNVQTKFLQSKELEPYHHLLEKLFLEAKYLLSEKEEHVLSVTYQSAHSNWVHMVSNFLSKESREVLTEDGSKKILDISQIVSLMSNTNKKVRDSAAKAFNDIMAKHVDVAENEMNSILYQKQTTDQLRKVSRPDLLRHISDDIETSVVDAMLASVEKRFDIAKRFYSLKAKLLGVKKLAYHERSVPVSEMNKKYSFQSAIDLVGTVFESLDPEFSSIFERLLAHGQVDVLPKKGKTTGAFCTSLLITQPTYVLLNYTEKLNDVLTLAHEMGHAINAEMMCAKQNALNIGTPLSTAEVASTFFENFTLQDILKKCSKEEKLTLLMENLNEDISTIFRQVAAYRFEQELHQQFREKGYLNHQQIGDIFQKHMASYMGDAVEMSDGSANWWVYWSHFRSFFYVYSYASGLLISKSMQNIVKNDPHAVGKIKQFLSAGSSKSTKDIFSDMGIDITDSQFWQSGITEMETLLNETEQLAKDLGKI